MVINTIGKPSAAAGRMQVRTVEDGLSFFRDLLAVNIPELGLTHPPTCPPASEPAVLRLQNKTTLQKDKIVSNPFQMVFWIVPMSQDGGIVL